MPESLTSKLNGDAEAYGDYLLCPFSREKPEEKQMVCIEAADNVIIRNRP